MKAAKILGNILLGSVCIIASLLLIGAWIIHINAWARPKQECVYNSVLEKEQCYDVTRR